MEKKLLALTMLGVLFGLLVFTPALATTDRENLGLPTPAPGGDPEDPGPLVDGEDPSDPDLVYLELRSDLDETRMVKKGGVATPVPAPYDITPGVFTGYLLQIWVNDDEDPLYDEELYFSICAPDRWDGENNPLVHVTSALSSAENSTAGYILNINWDRVTPNVVEVVPVAFRSYTAMRFALNAPQYSCYQDWFVIDYDYDLTDPMIAEDVMSFRLRRGSIVGWVQQGKDTDLVGDLIILEVSVLFPRDDLLGDPGDVVTTDNITDWIEDGTLIGGEEVEDVAVALEHFVFLTPLIFLSVLAFWKYNALIFMLAAGMSAITGLYWYDVYTTNWGLAIGILLVAYALVCLGFGLQCIFWKGKTSEQ